MFRVSYKTDIGQRRVNNQDAVLVCEDIGLFIVADGMGGHNSGEVASFLAVEIIEDYIRVNLKDNSKQEVIEQAFFKANKEIFLKSLKNSEHKGMGTTCSLVVSENKYIYIGHVGDSRIYSISNNKIEQITEDHTLVERLIKSGEITRAAAKTHPKRNVITRALGTEADIDVDFLTFSVEENSKIVICSDGLTNNVSDEEILEIVSDNSIDDAVNLLVKLANNRGGSDNITLILVEL